MAALSPKEFAVLVGARRGTVGRWLTEGLPFSVGPVHRRSGKPVSLIDPEAGLAWLDAKRKARRFGPPPAVHRKSFVYFARDVSSGHIKIGFSSNPAQRVIDLHKPAKGAHTVTLLVVVPGDKRAELATHRRFAHLRIEGEWFRAEPELLEHIDSLKERAA